MASRREGYRSKRPKPKRRRTYQYVTQDASPPLEVSPPRPPRSFVRRLSLSSPPGSWRADPEGFPFRTPRDSPDPDDDPAAFNNAAHVLAVLPSFARRDRINHDLQYSGTHNSGGSWQIPVPTLVGVARGTSYGQRATDFIRVSRLAFKLYVYRSTEGEVVPTVTPPIPLSLARYNCVYFRFVVVYDKQSDGVNPTSTYPDVFAAGPAQALQQFRLPATSERFEVLCDRLFEWRDGEITCGNFEVGGVGEPFYYQTGLTGYDEVFVDCDKLVHYNGIGSTVSSVISGNIYVMMSSVGVSALYPISVLLSCRTTFSDNL